MMKKKSICIITPVHWSYRMGGIEYQVKLLTDALVQNKDVNVTYLTRKLDDQFSPQNYELIQISKESPFRRYGFFMDTAKLLRHLKCIQPDVIYENGGCAYTGIAAYYAKKNACKSIWHVASDNDLQNKRRWSTLKPHQLIERHMLQWGINNSSVIIAQSEYQKQIIAQKNKTSIIKIVRNFHPTPEKIDSTEKSDIIAWVANLKTLKQPELYLELAERLHRRNIEIQCVMVGAPTVYPKGYQNELETRIDTIKNLKYFGSLQVDEVNRIIADSKLFINTSKWEGFPNTFIQSWMRKTPVVSLNCDPDNILRDHQCGVMSGSMDKMVEDVIDLLCNDKRRDTMGENAYNYAMRYHSFKNLEQLAKIIH